MLRLPVRITTVISCEKPSKTAGAMREVPAKPCADHRGRSKVIHPIHPTWITMDHPLGEECKGGESRLLSPCCCHSEPKGHGGCSRPPFSAPAGPSLPSPSQC